MHTFWGFGFSSEEGSTVEASPPEPAEVAKRHETAPASSLGPPQKSRSWASSVLESFRMDTRFENRATKSPGEEDLESSNLEAFRSLTRRAHQLLARRHHRALVSRRRAAHENSYATERLILAEAEADELEEVLKQHSRALGAGEEHGSPSDMCDTERLTMSGWSTSAASSATKPTELLCRWESEDTEARQELESLQTVMSQTAAELRSGLLHLARSPDSGDFASHGNVGLCRVLSAALPQLVQSCADAMEVGSSEDDWAGAEASLFEALVQVTSAEACESRDQAASDLDFQLQEDAFAHKAHGHGVSASPEEQRDQAALQQLLGRIHTLSQQLEQEAPKHSSQNASSGPDTGNNTNAASNSFGASATRLADLEAQVQRLVAENQALEKQLLGRFSEPPPSKAFQAVDRTELPPGVALPRDAGRRLSPAERVALSNNVRQRGRQNCAAPAAARPTQSSEPTRQMIHDLRSNLADAYEALALARSSARPGVSGRPAQDTEPELLARVCYKTSERALLPGRGEGRIPLNGTARPARPARCSLQLRRSSEAGTIAAAAAAVVPFLRERGRGGRRPFRPMTAARSDLEAEVTAAVEVVQRSMRLVQALACDMDVASPSLGKEMEACDITAGISAIKPGDSTPVTAADYAIQGLVFESLQKQFPADRFMGEEDAADLRADADLCGLALELCSKFGDSSITKESFLAAVDVGLVPPREGENRRVWVLDPIDGTKGFLTGQGYVIGLSLLMDGEALVGVMGYPNATATPPIMLAVKGHGLRWWPAEGPGPLEYEPPKPDWASQDFGQLPPPLPGQLQAGRDYPPWLLSPQSSRTACRPFGDAPATDMCCGSMVKYFAVAAGTHCGYVQYEEQLKTWDHACGILCVQESGGNACVTDAAGQPVFFPGRKFSVLGGIVSCSRWCTSEMRELLLQAAAGNASEGK
ncbi:unnamed protein product [Symbiodinium microadriaticum]|nr:unnamed protein product [Symbiodinium microadriaticum]